ncbi:acyl-CoA dehydrogenase family protein [Saccharothrix deserti]|uniref:acyl-CoA dehydrogenase family protein n=1 Tax=Saccharothrix deserti TaxID=2593674 RepID=UPI00131DEA15|nr:acyl-CoA dehydrogenase family protein [Saccharothrix deserti]
MTTTGSRERSAAALAEVTAAVADRAAEWDLAGRLPVDVVRGLAGRGLLCPDLPTEDGGLGLAGPRAGEYTAGVGALCSSLRSVLTSHDMAAWTVRRFGRDAHRAAQLARLTSGDLAAVAFSEPSAGSDLGAIATTIRPDRDALVVDGRKSWVTAAVYADVVVVFGRYADGGGIVLVNTDLPGVTVEPVPAPLGCRAAGHAEVLLDGVRVDRDALLGGAGLPLGMLVASALTAGRLSVAWGCVGILRACLAAATAHARTRTQFGVPLADHQLVARHLAELLVAERTATHTCVHAGELWAAGSPDAVTAAVLAKQVAATGAARGATAAVQVLGSAGAHDGHPVARAYRDAKLMEFIEGSTEINQLLLAEHALKVWS